MKLKNLSLALGLLLALPSIGLISCGKKKEGYTVKISVTDIGTAKVYRDTLKGGKLAGEKTGVGKEFQKTYQVAAGKTIIVTAIAEGSPVADTLKAKEEWKKAALVWAAAA